MEDHTHVWVPLLVRTFDYFHPKTKNNQQTATFYHNSDFNFVVLAIKSIGSDGFVLTNITAMINEHNFVNTLYCKFICFVLYLILTSANKENDKVSAIRPPY